MPAINPKPMPAPRVRASYRDDLLHSQMCPDLLSARAVAERMKRTLIDDLGGVAELPLNETDEGGQ